MDVVYEEVSRETLDDFVITSVNDIEVNDYEIVEAPDQFFKILSVGGL